MSDIDGIYGGKSTFEDARVTVTKFLDDFYSESPDNYNQSFLNLERRLQEYFGYKCKPRDSENGDVEAAAWLYDGERNMTWKNQLENDMDITKELFDFLWSCPHRERSGIAAGSGTEYIFEVKKSDLDKFEKLYIKAARGGSEDLEDDELPLECVTWKPNERGDGAGWTEGPYRRQYPGYDFDGFYESGPKVNIDCEKYLAFGIRLWYYDTFLKRLCCTDPQPYLNRSYVVCIVEDKK